MTVSITGTARPLRDLPPGSAFYLEEGGGPDVDAGDHYLLDPPQVVVSGIGTSRVNTFIAGKLIWVEPNRLVFEKG